MPDQNAITIDNAQLESLAAMISNRVNHTCVFSEAEVHAVKTFALIMEGDGSRNMREVVQFGGQLIEAKKVGFKAGIVILVGGLLSAIWVGLKTKLI